MPRCLSSLSLLSCWKWQTQTQSFGKVVKDNSVFSLDIKTAVCITVSLSWSLPAALLVQLCKKAESSGEFDLYLRCACTEQQCEPVDSQSLVLPSWRSGWEKLHEPTWCTASTKSLRRAARLASSSALCYSHRLRTGSGSAAPEITLHCSTSKADLLSRGGGRLGQHARRDTCQGTQVGRAELPHIAAAWGCRHWHPQ